MGAPGGPSLFYGLGREGGGKKKGVAGCSTAKKKTRKFSKKRGLAPSGSKNKLGKYAQGGITW